MLWLLGGDRNPSDEDIAIWDSMAYGLKAGSDQVHLVSYHSSGGHSSSEYFHDKDWLDFNTIQSRHQFARRRTTRSIELDYARTPVKPTLDMECRYEDHPDGRLVDLQRVFAGEIDPEHERIDAFDTREGAYWAVFAGAAGHGYGHNDIHQMADSRRTDSTRDYSHPLLPPHADWFVSIDSPGADSMGHLRRLVEMRPWHLTEPDDSVITAGRGEAESEDRASALRARDGSFVARLPHVRQPGVHRPRPDDRVRVQASWYDPRTGDLTRAWDLPTGRHPRVRGAIERTRPRLGARVGRRRRGPRRPTSRKPRP